MADQTNLNIALEGIDPVKRFVADLKGQMPYATMLALNNTMWRTRTHVQLRMESELQRPVTFTTGGVLYEKATKTSLKSRVYLRDEGSIGGSVARYMRVQIEGGSRGQKRSESRLRYNGILRGGEVLIPSKSMRLNVYGNVAAAQYSKMLSDLSASGGSTTLTSNRAYFYAEIKGTRGIWYRENGRIRLGWLIASGAKYKPRYRWDEAIRVAESKFLPEELDSALDRALATANRA